MKRRFLGVMLTLAVGLSLGLMVACGDDDGSKSTATSTGSGNAGSSPSRTGVSLTDADYFNGLETIFHDADTEGSRLQDELNQSVDASSTVDEQIAALNTFLDSSSKTFQNVLDALDKLDTPSAAQASQQAFVTAANDALSEIAQLKSDLRGVQTQADLDSALSDFETRFTTVTTAADAACVDLQKLASGSNVTIDLQCTSP